MYTALRHPRPKAVYHGLRARSFWKFVDLASRRYFSRILGPFPQHAPAIAIHQVFPYEWENYFKFCVIRNPWDKMISDYYWRIRNIADPPDFPDYVRSLARGQTPPGIGPEVQFHDNWEIYTLDGGVAVDDIIYYEDLTNGLDTVLKQKVGINWDGWLPRAKGTSRPRNGTGSAIYTPELADLVRQLYQKEITLGGYDYPHSKLSGQKNEWENDALLSPS